MRIILFVLLSAMVFSSAICIAQTQSQSQDVIYLKHGGIIKGTITEVIPNHTVKIQIADGRVFVYPVAELEKITMGKGQTPSLTTPVQTYKPQTEQAPQMDSARSSGSQIKAQVSKSYNYLAEGQNFMERGQWERAIDEFKVAVSVEFKDKSQYWSDGMQFVDYFPHREMGLCYFNLGDTVNARKELELSIAFAPSSRAREYLDKLGRGEVSSATVRPGLNKAEAEALARELEKIEEEKRLLDEQLAALERQETALDAKTARKNEIPQGQGQIYFYRPFIFVGCAIGLIIDINNQSIANLRVNRYIKTFANQGPISILIKNGISGNTFGEAFTINIEEGKTYFIKVGFTKHGIQNIDNEIALAEIAKCKVIGDSTKEAHKRVAKEGLFIGFSLPYVSIGGDFTGDKIYTDYYLDYGLGKSIGALTPMPKIESNIGIEVSMGFKSYFLETGYRFLTSKHKASFLGDVNIAEVSYIATGLYFKITPPINERFHYNVSLYLPVVNYNHITIKTLYPGLSDHTFNSFINFGLGSGLSYQIIPTLSMNLDINYHLIVYDSFNINPGNGIFDSNGKYVESGDISGGSLISNIGIKYSF